MQLDVEPIRACGPPQLFGQFDGFATLQQRIPDDKGPGRKPLLAGAQRGHHGAVVRCEFVRRIDQHQSPARRWRQNRFHSHESVAGRDGHAAPFLRKLRGQNLLLGAVQFEEAQAILRPQHAERDPWRTRIVPQHAIRIRGADQPQIVGHGFRRIVSPPEQFNAVAKLGVPDRVSLLERIHAGAGMRIDHQQRLLLLGEKSQQRDQHDVLQRVGVVAGMVAVAIAQHRAELRYRRGRRLDPCRRTSG